MVWSFSSRFNLTIPHYHWFRGDAMKNEALGLYCVGAFFGTTRSADRRTNCQLKTTKSQMTSFVFTLDLKKVRPALNDLVPLKIREIGLNSRSFSFHFHLCIAFEGRSHHVKFTHKQLCWWEKNLRFFIKPSSVKILLMVFSKNIMCLFRILIFQPDLPTRFHCWEVTFQWLVRRREEFKELILCCMPCDSLREWDRTLFMWLVTLTNKVSLIFWSRSTVARFLNIRNVCEKTWRATLR